MLLAGPFTGRLLGDMGAEVIKVEPPGQPDPMREWGKARYEGRSLWWPVQSREQEVRHAQPAGSSAASSCSSSWSSTRTSLTENFRPGTLERWNVGYEPLREANPSLVIARVSGYGQTGPYAERAGFASVSEAMGGIRHINGFPDEPPPRMHISLGDSLAGMFAAQGILAALYERDALGCDTGPGGRRLAARVVASRCWRAPCPSTTGSASSAAPGTRAQGRRAVEHLQVARRQVDRHRRERRQRLPAAVRGDGQARAGRRCALLDAPRPRRQPGGDRGHRRRLGRRRTTRPRSTGR